MTESIGQQRALALWLFVVCGLVAVLVVFGGWVRLSRSGLSIVRWEVVTGIVPPLGEEAWQTAFADYRQTPEYLKVNAGMSLEEYRWIYLNEYLHRLLGRLAGLAFVVPLVVFLLRGALPRSRAVRYASIALLFAAQGLMGWYMVRSGLVDRPSVSHLRLTSHLLLALALLALCLWSGLDHLAAAQGRRRVVRPPVARLAGVVTALLVAQITWGALVAGLKAGHVSDSFPLMFGRWLPPALLSTLEPWWANLVSSPVTVHFVHRWLGFAVALSSLALLVAVRRAGVAAAAVRVAVTAIAELAWIQVALGVGVVLFHVAIPLALLHQAVALVLFALLVLVLHRLGCGERSAPSVVGATA